MALKTFNVDEKLYKQYSDHCKKEGISMSKRVSMFIEQELAKLGVTAQEQPETKRAPMTVHSPSKYS